MFEADDAPGQHDSYCSAACKAAWTSGAIECQQPQTQQVAVPLAATAVATEPELCELRAVQAEVAALRAELAA